MDRNLGYSRGEQVGRRNRRQAERADWWSCPSAARRSQSAARRSQSAARRFQSAVRKFQLAAQVPSAVRRFPVAVRRFPVVAAEGAGRPMVSEAVRSFVQAMETGGRRMAARRWPEQPGRAPAYPSWRFVRQMMVDAPPGRPAAAEPPLTLVEFGWVTVGGKPAGAGVDGAKSRLDCAPGPMQPARHTSDAVAIASRLVQRPIGVRIESFMRSATSQVDYLWERNELGWFVWLTVK